MWPGYYSQDVTLVLVNWLREPGITGWGDIGGGGGGVGGSCECNFTVNLQMALTINSSHVFMQDFEH